MILVDTSVWIDHLRGGNQVLSDLLNAGAVLAHPFVIGELALGSLWQRKLILDAVANLPRAHVATDSEVLQYIDNFALFARGIGYVDCHLLAAVRLTAGAELWTHDKHLAIVAEELGAAWITPQKSQRSEIDAAEPMLQASADSDARSCRSTIRADLPRRPRK